MQVRLQKFIADCGVSSRRKAEELILQGRVKVNNVITTILGTKIDPEEDIIEVDGQNLDLNTISRIYVLMHKPRGVMTTVSDPEGRKTVMDFCKEISERIYPVGRLDYLSEGLLLLTNDGEMANRIMHPRYNIVKVYEVKIFGIVNEDLMKKLRAGAMIENEFLKPQSVRVIKQLDNKTWLEFRINEGRNREIRRLCEYAGLTVDKLKRVAIGNLTIDGIAPGKLRYLNRKDLLKALGMDSQGKNIKEVNYISPKKTIEVKKIKNRFGTPANDKKFYKYRREYYFATLQAIKENKLADNELLKAERKSKMTTKTQKEF